MDSHLVLIIISALLLSTSGQRNRNQNRNYKTRLLPNLDVCGLTKSTVFDTKIINGKPAELGAFPWIAAIGYVVRDSQFPSWNCGGSLITDQYVITAAHCLDPKIIQMRRPIRPTTVRLGELDLNPDAEDGATPTDYKIEKYVFHEEYDNARKVNDIGLIRLRDKVKYTELIRPICLPPPEFVDHEYIGYSPVVAGWGKSENSNRKSDTRLLQAEVQIQELGECGRNITSTKLLANAIVDRRVICASSPGKDSCQGDSGGPLMFFKTLKNVPKQSSGNMFLMGIVSYGYGCAIAGYPGVYTRVSSYMLWIVDHLDF